MHSLLPTMLLLALLLFSSDFAYTEPLGILVRAVRMGQRTAEQVLSLLEQIPSRSTLFVQQVLLADFIIAFKKEFGI